MIVINNIVVVIVIIPGRVWLGMHGWELSGRSIIRMTPSNKRVVTRDHIQYIETRVTTQETQVTTQTCLAWTGSTH